MRRALHEHAEVDFVVEHRRSAEIGENEFRVRWKNCGPEEDEWLRAADFDHPQILTKYFAWRKAQSAAHPQNDGRA